MKNDITNLEEGLEERKEKEDKRLEFLENFKNGIEEASAELFRDLNEFDNEIGD